MTLTSQPFQPPSLEHESSQERTHRSAPPKPDRRTAMLQLIAQVAQHLPLQEPETFICGPKGDCIGCPKKLLELVDSELSYWQAALNNGEVPQLGEISRLAKLAKNVHRALVRSGVIDRYQALKQNSVTQKQLN